MSATQKTITLTPTRGVMAEMFEESGFICPNCAGEGYILQRGRHGSDEGEQHICTRCRGAKTLTATVKIEWKATVQVVDHAASIINEFCTATGIDKEDILSRKRGEQLAAHRHLLAYILVKRQFGKTETGRRINRSHSDVVYAVRRVAELLQQEDKLMRSICEKVKHLLD